MDRNAVLGSIVEKLVRADDKAVNCIDALLNKVNGDSSIDWTDRLGKFNRGELVPVGQQELSVELMVGPNGCHLVPTTDSNFSKWGLVQIREPMMPFKIENFEPGSSWAQYRKIRFVSDQFRMRMFGKVEPSHQPRSLAYADTRREVHPLTILTRFGGAAKAEVLISEIAQLFDGEDSDLILGPSNAFFVKDVHGKNALLLVKFDVDGWTLALAPINLGSFKGRVYMPTSLAVP